MIKPIRKWSRILHRDFGFFFIGTSIIFGLSGIALNHLSDWNPNYIVENKAFTTSADLSKGAATAETIKEVAGRVADGYVMQKYYYPNDHRIKIFLKGGSSILIHTETGQGNVEFLQKRPLFYQVNILHYNPNRWWTWFSDIFCGALILFAITSLFMVKGKKGFAGRGGIYTLAGILSPLIILWLSV